MTQIAQRNNHVLQMLKRLKETLENDKKKYADKVNVLVMTWERIAASAREQRPLAAICIVEKMYKDTLSIMLQGEWPKMSPVSKTHLMQMLNRCRIDLCKEMPWLDYKFKKLLELVNEPWTLPSLERIMHKDPCPPTPEQIIEFCESERGLLIVTRLTMLCSSRCEKVAIRLAEACFNALTSANSSLIGLFTSYEYNFIFDIYLCLLYKYKKLESIINALKPVIVNDGYAMVLRLKKRINMHEQKIWKFSVQVATIAARYFVTVSMLSRSIPNSALLKNLINDWLSMSNASQNNLENEIRKIIQPAETSEHIYIIAEVLAKMFQQLGNQMYSSLIMELYIRALTADINYLERVKLQNDREQITAYEKHLAAKFLEMADLVKDHAGVRREFVLTAFSIHPSAEIYRRVEEEAVASGKASPHSTPTSQESMEVGVLSEGLSSLSSEELDVKETAIDYSVNNDSQDSGAFVEISNRCSLHLPYDGIGPEGELCFQCGDFTGVQNSRNLSDSQQIKKERTLDALILIKGNTVTESLNYDVLSAPSQVLEAEKLGLSSQVCADLVTLLGSNRYHLLTWVLEWGELSSRCIRYMNEADTIKSGKKELKFLEIDYNQYKDWPENQEEGDCIEKGYEQWLEEDNTETDIDTDSKKSNTDDSEEMSMLKTAIRRSQKQVGRYAESSSDSDDYRSRNKNKKRGKAKKRSKYMSDSGSVSDCLGNDGQKQKRSNKKSRKESKDLKKFYSLRVLEMSRDNSTLTCSKEEISSGVLESQSRSLSATLAARSDPTVLKSLRAFRLNAHKTKQNEFVQAITKNCPNSKSYQGKMTSISKESVFDCNDNKFITKENRLVIKDNVLDMNFRTNGAKTKKYNDVIRSIKEDLISVSNIPCITNNATVQVIHLQDTSKPRDISQSQTSQVSASDTQTISTSSTSLATGIEIISNEKLKPVNDSHGSQIRKTTSSQQAETTNTGLTVGKTYLPTAVTRSVPSRVMVSAFNNSVSNASDSSRIINQPQFRAIVSRNTVNQNRATSSENVRNIVNFQLSSVPSLNANLKNSGQTLIAQVEKTTVITTSTNTPTTSGTIKVIQGFERQFQNRNYLIQHLRANTATLNVHDARQASSSGQNAISSEVSNNSPKTEKTKDSNGNALRINVTTLDSIKPFDSSKCENSLENISCSGTNVIVNPTSKCSNAARSLPVKYVNELDVQSVNGSCSSSSGNFIKSSTETNVITVAPQSQRPVINKPSQKVVNERITYQANLISAHRNYSGQMNGATHNKQIPSSSVNVTQVSNNAEEKSIFSHSCPSGASEGSNSINAGQIKIVSTLAGLLSDTRNNSPANSIPTSSFGNRTFVNFPKVCGNKISCAEFVKVEDIKGTATNVSSSVSTSSSSTALSSSSSSSSSSSLSSSSSSSSSSLLLSSTSSLPSSTSLSSSSLPLSSSSLISSSSSSSLLSTSSCPSSSSLTLTSTSSILSSTLSSSSLNDNSQATTGVLHNEEIDALQSPAEGFEVRLACKNLTTKNMLTTVLKQSSNNKTPPPFAISHFSQFNARSEAADQTEPVSNVLISQSSTSNTIHYTVINPNTIQQNTVSDGLNSNIGDMVERVVRQEDFVTPRSVIPPSSNQLKNSTYDSCSSSKAAIPEENPRSDENVSGHQKVIVPSKRIKSNSSQSFGQNEASFIKKQVFNNQKITILVQNNGDNREESENQQKNCKLSEFFVKDDQRPNITFRAIKRTPSNVNINEAPPSKKISQGLSSNQNGELEMRERRDGPMVDSKEDPNPSGTLCQYLVLEAINDPSGALPKFNQAFGKSYQIKLPQPVKAMDSSENVENDGSVLSESSKSDNKAATESHLTPLLLMNQVPVTEAVKENPLEVIPKSVKSVYIDKEVKTEVHSSLKLNDGTIDTSASIPAIHMTEIQQPSANAFQNLSKVARSTVVQQLIRKIPTTGPSTLQAVTSISTVNSVNSRQGKTQDVVSTPTLIYATAARAQSQILIQRAVGRANAPTVNQVAPVIYTQQPSDQPATQTQTLLLAAVPSGTRGVVPGTQLVRLPSNSGIWRMAPSVNSSRIVQLRPQNLVLQGNQDQGVVMHSSQPVLLHHLTSLPVKPVGVGNSAKPDETVKADLKSDVYIKDEGNSEAKMCSLEIQQNPVKNEPSSPVNISSEHETVALMKDIKEFENVFEETKLKFEMEEQQSVCIPEMENIPESKQQILTTVDANQEPQSLTTHQTVLVQPQIMLHKPQMIITSATPNKPTVFRPKIEKVFSLHKDSEERLLLTPKPTKDIQLKIEEGSQPSHVTLAYVSHQPTSSAIQKPLVVVTNYGQPPSSPAPSITSQSSSSPNSIVSTSSFSNAAPSTKGSTKSKGRSNKATNTSKTPPVSKPQQKPQEDANTAQKIYAILEEYAVQLRNSPDMNNRPAPRRRSNPPACANSKRKRTICKTKESLSDGDEGNYSEDVTEPLPSSEDSSSGVTVLQVCVTTSH